MKLTFGEFLALLCGGSIILGFLLFIISLISYDPTLVVLSAFFIVAGVFIAYGYTKTEEISDNLKKK